MPTIECAVLHPTMRVYHADEISIDEVPGIIQVYGVLMRVQLQTQIHPDSHHSIWRQKKAMHVTAVWDKV